VDSLDSLVSRFGLERTIGGYYMILSEIESPGVIRHRVTPTIHLGAIGGEKALEHLGCISKALRVEGVSVVVEEDVEVGLWCKFILMCSWGTIGAICRAPIGTVRTVPETRALLVAALTECRNVGVGLLAKGVAVPADVVEKSMGVLDAAPVNSTSSLQRDIASGRPSELADWTGAMVQIDQQLGGQQAPLHRIMYAALLPQEKLARKTL
jgi:2-dehydropantoate 2-reductase